MTIKEVIADMDKNKRRFTIMANFYTFLDILTYDLSDPDNFRMLCKFNTDPIPIVQATFGTPQHPNGLQEIIVPYSQIVAVIALDASQDLLDKFKKDYPAAYDWWSKVNYVEGVGFNGGVMDPLHQSKAVQEYNKNNPNYKPIKTTIEEDVVKF